MSGKQVLVGFFGEYGLQGLLCANKHTQSYYKSKLFGIHVGTCSRCFYGFNQVALLFVSVSLALAEAYKCLYACTFQYMCIQ